METRVVYTDDQDRDVAIAANPGLRLVRDERHITGEDGDGNPVYESALVFTDAPAGQTVDDRLAALESDNADLRSRTEALDEIPRA